MNNIDKNQNNGGGIVLLDTKQLKNFYKENYIITILKICL